MILFVLFVAGCNLCLGFAAAVLLGHGPGDWSEATAPFRPPRREQPPSTAIDAVRPGGDASGVSLEDALEEFERDLAGIRP